VPRIDVLTRIALAFEEAGDSAAAVSLLREVAGLYLKAPAADPEERDLALARARFQLGRCLIAAGAEADGLAETETGLELAASVLSRLQLPAAGPGGQADQRGWAVSGQGADPGWLARAPRFLQLAAPDWVAAAARAMSLHRAAGRWSRAAAAARTAVAVSGGLAGLGGDTLRETHAAITARADEVLAQAALTSQPQATARPAATAAPSGPAAPDHGPRKKQGKAKHPERSAAD
jgi:hypothetical protein